MHAPLILILSIFSIFARTLQFGQLLQEPENIVGQKEAVSANQDELNALSKSTKKREVSYKLLPTASTFDALITAWTEKGAERYAYLALTAIGGIGTSELLDLYITVKKFSRRYDYKFVNVPQESAAFLRQANELGKKGFRLKASLNNDTQQVSGYIRDTSRPLATYTYQHLPCVGNVSDFTFQANQQAAKGYRYIDALQIGDLCSVYIKDTSEKFKFTCEIAPSYASTAAFVAGANSQGAQGYRYVGSNLIFLKSGDFTYLARWRAFYRDTTQTYCTYKYASFQTPNTTALYFEQIDQQAAKGFIFLTSYLSIDGNRYTYYIKPKGCHFRALNIDGLY